MLKNFRGIALRVKNKDNIMKIVSTNSPDSPYGDNLYEVERRSRMPTVFRLMAGVNVTLGRNESVRQSLVRRTSKPTPPSSYGENKL